MRPILFGFGLATIVSAQTSTVTVTSPGHSPAASLLPINKNYLGLSFEALSWAKTTGTLARPNNFSLNLLSAISSRVGTLPIRVGGGTGDNIYYDPSQAQAVTTQTSGPHAGMHVIGPSYTAGFTLVNSSSWVVPMPLLANNLTNAIQFANLVYNAMAPGTFEAFEIGNEVDIYPSNALSEFGSPYSPSVYATAWKNWTQSFTKNVQLPANRANFWAFSFLNPPQWNLTSAYNSGFQTATGLRAISQHLYFGNPVNGTGSYISYILNHTATSQYIDMYASELSFATSKNLPLILGEVGLSEDEYDLSNVNIGLGAAIWGVDFMLYSMSRGCQRVNWENVAGGQLGGFNPIPSSSYNTTVFGLFYAWVFIADLFSITPGNMTVSPISTSSPNITAYGTYDGGLIHTVVVLNENLYLSGGATRPTTQITLTGFPDVTSVTAQYLSGPAADVYMGLSWAGQTWSNVTGLPGPGVNDTATYTVNNGAVTIPLLASQAVRVMLSRSS